MHHSLAHAGGHGAQGHCSPAGDLGPDRSPNSAPSRLCIVPPPFYCSPCTPAPCAAHPAVPSGHPGSSSLGAVPGLAVSLHIWASIWGTRSLPDLGGPSPRPYPCPLPQSGLFCSAQRIRMGASRGLPGIQATLRGTWLFTSARLASTLRH